MVKIPQYNAQLSLTKQAPGVSVDAQAYGQQARAVGQIGETLFKVGEKIKEIRTADAVNQRTLQSKALLNQVGWDAYNDNDLDGYEDKYQKRFEEVRQQVLAGIKDQNVAREVGLRLESDILDSEFKVNQYYRNKVIDSDRATLADTLSSLQTEYVNTPDPKGKQIVLGKISSAVQATADRGSISKLDAQNTLINVKTNLPERQAAFDAANNPEAYFKNRGAYGIAADKLADTDKIAEKTLSELKVTTLQDQFKNQREFSNSLEGKPISQALEELEDLKNGRAVDEKWAKAQREAILSNAGVDQEKKDEFYYSVLMEINDASAVYKEKKKKATAQEYLAKLRGIEIKINQGVANGLLDSSSKQNLLNDIYNSTTSEAVGKAIKGVWGYDIANADIEFRKAGMGTLDRYRAIAQYFEGTIDKGLNGEEKKNLAKEIINQYQNSDHEIGDIINTPKGAVKVVGKREDGELIIEVLNNAQNNQ